MNLVKSVLTSMVENTDSFIVEAVVCKTEPSKANYLPYRPPTGILLHLRTHTRPYISFSFEVLSRLVANLSAVHGNPAKWVLGYLLGTVLLGIMIGNGVEIDSTPDRNISAISAYSDGDWAGDMHSRKSTGSYTVMLNVGFGW